MSILYCIGLMGYVVMIVYLPNPKSILDAIPASA